MDIRAWATQLAKLRTTRQWFDHFASVQRDGDRFMTSQDLLRAIALFPSEDALREVWKTRVMWYSTVYTC